MTRNEAGWSFGSAVVMGGLALCGVGTTAFMQSGLEGMGIDTTGYMHAAILSATIGTILGWTGGYLFGRYLDRQTPTRR